MEYEGLAQRMQALFDSFNEDVGLTSDSDAVQKELNTQRLSLQHNNEHCPILHSTDSTNDGVMPGQCSSQPWFPWREQDSELCKPQCPPVLNNWLSVPTSTEKFSSLNGDCFKVTSNQSPATDPKTSKLVTLLADSDYSMHHLEMDYAHHKHCLHHNYAGHITTHFTQSKRVNSEQSQFETIPSLDDDNASVVSNLSRPEPHHSNKFPHHHQHYHHHHHHHNRHNYHQHAQWANCHPLPWLQDCPPQDKQCNTLQSPVEPSNSDGHVGAIVEFDVENEKPISLEDLKEWRRNKMSIDNDIHNTWNSLHFRVIQWLSDLQCDASVLTTKDDSITTENIL